MSEDVTVRVEGFMENIIIWFIEFMYNFKFSVDPNGKS